MLCQRYEQIRARALQPSAMGISGAVLRLGMRSWMEAGCQAEMKDVVPAPTAGTLRSDESFQEIVTVLADVLVGQAERSYSEPRSV
jgi:hypothetical protein